MTDHSRHSNFFLSDGQTSWSTKENAGGNWSSCWFDAFARLWGSASTSLSWSNIPGSHALEPGTSGGRCACFDWRRLLQRILHSEGCVLYLISSNVQPSHMIFTTRNHCFWECMVRKPAPLNFYFPWTFIPCRAMNHDEDVYPEPFAFKPERFFDENGKLNQNDRILSYGFGRRQVHISHAWKICHSNDLGHNDSLTGFALEKQLQVH